MILQVFRSIGYKSVAVGDDVPFDSKRGIIPNVNGRVVELGKCISYMFSHLMFA